MKNLPWKGRGQGQMTRFRILHPIIIIIIIFLDPGTQFPRKEKITLCNIKKYKVKLEWTLLLLLLHKTVMQ